MTGTPDSELVFINEAFDAESVTPGQFDALLSNGWRHFGTRFFRYSLNLYREKIVRVIPLRIRLSDFRASKSQRRVLQKNADLTIEFGPIEITDEIEQLFNVHKERFTQGAPRSIYDFLSVDAANFPTRGFQITARDAKKRLLAISFFDIGENSVSAIYGCFDPNDSRRSPGILTMLKVIEFAASKGKSFYYHGYAYDVKSFYDYKKQFSALEAFDWAGQWRPL